MKKTAMFLMMISLCSCGNKENDFDAITSDHFDARISGVITDCYSGVPVKSAKLTLYKEEIQDLEEGYHEISKIDEIETNAQGEYQFLGDLENGKYSINVFKDGYLNHHVAPCDGGTSFYLYGSNDKIMDFELAKESWIKIKRSQDFEYMSGVIKITPETNSCFENSPCYTNPSSNSVFSTRTFDEAYRLYQIRGNSNIVIKWGTLDFPDIDIIDSFFVASNDTLVYEIKY